MNPIFIASQATQSDGTEKDLTWPPTETFVLGELRHGYLGEIVPFPHVAKIPTWSEYTSVTHASSDYDVVDFRTGDTRGVLLKAPGAARITVTLSLLNGGSAAAYMDVLISENGLENCVVYPAEVTDPVPQVSPSPVITTQPANSTIASGATATVSVVAAPVTDYQWQTSPLPSSNFTDIPNAKAATFTTPALTANKYYRCRMNNTESGKTKSPTVLTTAALVTVTP